MAYIITSNIASENIVSLNATITVKSRDQCTGNYSHVKQKYEIGSADKQPS
jgi:hypothetical protein